MAEKLEKVYWISNGKDQRFVNRELAKYGGHVTMISAAASTEDQSDCVHVFLVAEYSKDSFPDNYD